MQKMNNAFVLPSKKDFLISGYSKLQLPDKIKYLCILFADEFFENKYIPFSTKFKTKKGIELTENNHCASKSDYHRSSWIVSDIEPVQYGIRCWRILVNNPNSAFIRFAVGSKRILSQDSICGIAYDAKRKLSIWRPAASIKTRNRINLKHFSQKKCVVDMLLDANKGVLKMCVVGMCDDQHEARIWGMATTKLYQRWVPHFTFGSTADGASLQVTEIYKGYYGKDMNINPLTNIELVHYVEKHYSHDFALDLLKLNQKNTDTFTFHFCGIKPSKSHKITSNISTDSNMNMFDDIKVDSFITVKSSLNELNTIKSLKKLVRETYGLSWSTDIIILYSDKIISMDDALNLDHFNITDGSLFIIAIANYSYCLKLGWSCSKCTFLNSQDNRKCEMCGNVVDQLEVTCVKALNPLLHPTETTKLKVDASDDSQGLNISIKPVKGFDIITQESNVDVYCMPGCNHVMSKDSLYHYALTTFKDDNNLCIKCPHSNDEYKADQWACAFCTYFNKISRNTCEMCTNAKPEIKPYCHTEWKYSSIKQILLSTEKDIEQFETYKLELLSARNKIHKTCDVQKCPTCNTLYYRKDDEDKLKLSEIQSIQAINQHFKTRCVICNDKKTESKYDEPEVSPLMVQAKMNKFGTLPFNLEKPIRWKSVNDKCTVTVKSDEDGYFCWGCGKSWEYGHVCDSSFKEDLVEILINAKTKKIGSVDNVPSMRACPKCAILITHSDACKHMKCGSCKLDFCFVCLKPKKNGNWQCGSHSSICPVAPPQNMETLPNTIVLNKNTFKLF